jgi:thymidine kinase
MAKLYFYYSAMNAGKSTTLLQAEFNYRERGMNPLLISPLLDNRHGIGKITSRLGLQANAFGISQDTDVFAFVKEKHTQAKLDCLLIDEAQFLSESQVKQLARCADELNIPVLCYGLRTDFQGNLFPGSKILLGWADALTEIKTICHCGRKATMNMRLNEQGMPVTEGAQVDIGGNDRYISVCRRHFVMQKVSSKE